MCLLIRKALTNVLADAKKLTNVPADAKSAH
jgi:hypothetical protein